MAARRIMRALGCALVVASSLVQARVTEIVVEFFASTTLVPDPRIHLREAAGRATYDGKPGVGWLEVGWPAAYLDYAADARSR